MTSKPKVQWMRQQVKASLIYLVICPAVKAQASIMNRHLRTVKAFVVYQLLMHQAVEAFINTSEC